MANGKVVKAGEQIVLGGNESYVALCRKHWKNGELAPEEIRRIAAGKREYLPLLLDADPSEAMIDRYLDAGDMYVLFAHGCAVAEAVITRREDGCELKNLATEKDARGKGYATRLLMHLFRLLAAEHERMYVGTCEDLLPFYEKLGFEYAWTAPHFFRDNYPGVTFEEGELDDMTYLVRPLR